jgi:hypothetical protein
VKPSILFRSAACALLIVLAVLEGCSGKPPVLSRVYGRVIYTHDPATGVNGETLGVFLVASDPDGIENLSAFYVINDDAELFWKVDNSTWVSSVAEGENWIGTTSIAMPGSTPFPSGDYRVVLQNSSGDTVEDTLSVPTRSVFAPDAKYPSARVEGGIIKVLDAGKNAEIWTYANDGKFMGAYAAAGPGAPITVAAIAAGAPALAAGFQFRVFVWDEQGGYGALSGPYSSASGPAGAATGARP